MLECYAEYILPRLEEAQGNGLFDVGAKHIRFVFNKLARHVAMDSIIEVMASRLVFVKSYGFNREFKKIMMMQCSEF